MTGGNIKDEAGNEANLSCPLITGNTIKANVDGTTTTETENQDKQKDEKGNEENNETEEKKDTETGKKEEESQKEETGMKDPEEKKDPDEDDTKAKDDNLPYTGKGITIVMIMLGLAVVATVAYSKFRYLKEV